MHGHELLSDLCAVGNISGCTKKDPRELVVRLKNASVEDIKKLSFFELNLLKNAVYASKGYKFADDRPWLNQIFCEKNTERFKEEGSLRDEPH